MKKKYIGTLLILTTILSAETNITIPTEEPKVRIISLEEDLPYLNAIKLKYNKLDKRTRKMNLELEETISNYKDAADDLKVVEEVQALVKNVSENEKCYIAYTRIKDLNSKLKTGTNIDTLIYHKIKKPLKEFLGTCKNMRIDLLEKKYGERND